MIIHVHVDKVFALISTYMKFNTNMILNMKTAKCSFSITLALQF